MALLSLPILHAVHSPQTLPNSLQVMAAPPVPTRPSKCQASLGLRIDTKQITGFGLHLPCDFLPFLFKILDSHRHHFFSRNFILKPAQQTLNASLGPLSDSYISLSFFSSVSTWMSFAMLKAKAVLLEFCFSPERIF